MKLYKIYLSIPENIYNRRIKWLVSKETFTDYHFRKDGKHVYGLYAWATKRKIIDEFKSTRFMDAFVINKSNIDEDDLADFKHKYSNLELKSRIYYFSVRYDPNHFMYHEDNVDIVDNASVNNKMEMISSEVVTTKQEWIESTHNLHENMDRYCMTSTKIDYKIFKSHIIDALDVLGYTITHDLKFESTLSGDEAFSRQIKAERNYHHNVTIKGNKLIKYHENEYVGLMYLYSYLFFGV